MNYTNDDYERELTESETMDGLISSIVGGIKKRVKAKRERKKAQSQVSTPAGAANLSPTGTFNYTQQGQQSNDILKNPVVLAGLIGIPLLLILLAKRS